MPSPPARSTRPILLVAGLAVVLGLAAALILLMRPDSAGDTNALPVATELRGADEGQPSFQGQAPVRTADRLPRELPLGGVPGATNLTEQRLAAVSGPRGSIEGLALNHGRQPIAGVRISLHKGNPMFAGQFPGMRQALDLSVESAVDGRFRFADVPVERAYVLIGEHENYARSEAGGIGVVADQVTSGVVLVMSEGAVIQGTVVTLAGSPISDARVELYYLLDMNVLNPAEQRPWKVMFTDAGGRFAFTHVSATSMRVRVEAMGHETQTRNLTYVFEGAPKDENLRFELGEGMSLPGRVMSADSKPLAGARLEATAIAQGEHGSSITVSDPNGYFILDGLNAAHSYQLVATRAGYTDRRMPRISATAGTLQVVMDERGVAFGRVSDSGGRAVTRFALALLKAYPGREPSPLGDVRDFSSADGSFRFDNIDPGDYVLEARAEGLADSHSPIFTIGRDESDPDNWIAVPPPVPVDIVMVQGATLRGTVREMGGSNVAGARVQLNPNNHVDSPLTQIFRFMGPSDERSIETVTDAEGRYEFKHVSPGTYQLRASSDDSAPVAVNDIVAVDDSQGGNRPVDLTLPRSALIAGRAVDSNSSPLAFCKIQIMRVGDSSFMEASTTDPQGGFSFTNLASGKYSIMVTPMKDELGQPLHPLLSLVAASKSQLEVFVSEGQAYENVLVRLPPLAGGMR